jgi:ribonuclease R
MDQNKIKLTISDAKKISLDNLLNKLNSRFDKVEPILKEICGTEDHEYVWGLDNNFYFIDNKTYFYGRLRVTERGFGFAINDSDEVEDAFVPPTALKNGINGDEVVYTVEKENDGRLKASVVEIAVRDKTTLIGNIERNGEYLDFVPNEASFKNFRFRILNKREFRFKESDIVSAKIVRIENRFMYVRLVKVIGTSDKPADRILAIAYEFGIKPDFDQKVIAESEKVAKPIDYNDDLIKRRKKIIKDLNLVTIDGVDSKDLDDAIYVEKNNDGFRLLVAIADVAHYVRPKSDLDFSAMNRGNSVYLADRVIPMLPKNLSDGVCSLNPNEEKLCMVCDMQFSKEGRLVSKEVYESIMISKARLNYKQVNKYFETGKIDETDVTAKVLDASLELHNLIEGLKDEKGVIDFDIDEPKIILDKDSNVIDVEVRERGISERLIENFMVAANESVATTIFDKELPFIYRNHDRPNPQDVIDWMASLKLLGINANITNDLTELKPRDLRIVLEQIDKAIEDEKEKTVVNITLLHHMAKAKYQLDNIGHFGLASECYTHFTSPIRRYSDLMVHRYLKQYLVDKEISRDRLDANEKFIKKAANIINDTEKAAVDAEREVIKVCSTEYMTKHVGETFEGIVAAVLKFGLFIQIDKCIEGLVHISNLPDFTYDPKTNIMINKNNVFYRIGQKVKIKVSNADVKKRTIDFELITK